MPKKILPRLWTTIWQRKAVWKTSFQTNPQELSTLCIYPKQLLNNTKNLPIKKTLSNLSQLFPNIFIRQLQRNIPLTTMTYPSCSILESTCTGKKMHQLYRTWRGMLTGAVLSKLAHPDWLWLSRHALQWVKARPPTQKKRKTTL